jgi:2,3-bisphosphoglycerate-dependent phosphoglycerate mutase
MPRLVLIRHGQSQWNLENRFTGWVDVDLSDQGVAEARLAGELLADQGWSFDRAYVSSLKRAIRTLWIALDVMDRMWLPQTVSWRLNERHYGALQGLNKEETARLHGEKQVHVWRRGYDVPPPLMTPDDPGHPRGDKRYAHVDPHLLPAGESLKNTLDRVLPYWNQEIVPQINNGRNVMIAAHGNSLRALIKHLFQVPDMEIPLVEIPTGNPLCLELDTNLLIHNAHYLDQDHAQAIPFR